MPLREGVGGYTAPLAAAPRVSPRSQAMRQVFLSFPGRHRGWTRVLHGNLERCLGEQHVFLDDKDLGPGRSWTAGLQEGIATARRVVIVAAPESFASPWVRHELEGFQAAHPHWKAEGLIQVVLLVDTPLPPFLRSAQHVDFREHDGDRYLEGLGRLVAGLKGLDEVSHAAPLPDGVERPRPPVPELATELRAELVRLLAPLLAPPFARTSLASKLDLPAGALDGHASPELAASAALVVPVELSPETAAGRAARVVEVVLDQALADPGPAGELRDVLGQLAAVDRLRTSSAAAPPRRRSLQPPARLCHPTGAVPLDSDLYVRRDTDALAEAELDRPHGMVHVLGPRQMGKSSLLIRLAERARRRPAGPLVVTVNFQDLDLDSLADLRRLLASLAGEMLEAAGRDPDLAGEILSSKLTAKLACRRLLAREVLAHHEHGVLWLLDEVDRVVRRDGGCAQDFMSMLRAWHEAGVNDPVLARLRMGLCFCTEAHMIAPGVSESPLHNVGLKCILDDFDAGEVARLVESHGIPGDRAPARELARELGGNPYLVRRTLYAIACEEAEWPEILAQARELGGPLGDFLRHHHRHLEERPELARAMRAVLRGEGEIDPDLARGLEGMGLIRRRGRAWEARYRLYATALGDPA